MDIHYRTLQDTCHIVSKLPLDSIFHILLILKVFIAIVGKIFANMKYQRIISTTEIRMVILSIFQVVKKSDRYPDILGG